MSSAAVIGRTACELVQAARVSARTSGTASATTMPARQPRLRKLTAMTIKSASARLSTNS